MMNTMQQTHQANISEEQEDMSKSGALSPVNVNSSVNSMLVEITTQAAVTRVSSYLSDHEDEEPIQTTGSSKENVDENPATGIDKKPERTGISSAVLKYDSQIDHYYTAQGSSSGSGSKNHNENVTIQTQGKGKDQEEIFVDCISKEVSNVLPPLSTALPSGPLDLRARMSPNNLTAPEIILEPQKSQESRPQLPECNSSQAMSNQKDVSNRNSAAVTSSGIRHHDKKEEQRSSGADGFACKHCDRKYGRERDFKEHVVSHTSDACKCLVCFKSYATVSGMLFHLQKLHWDTKFYNCPRCRVFTTLSKEDFRAHLMQVHKTETRTSPRVSGGGAVKGVSSEMGRTSAGAAAASGLNDTQESIAAQRKTPSSTTSIKSRRLFETSTISAPAKPMGLSMEGSEVAQQTAVEPPMQSRITSSSALDMVIDETPRVSGNSASSWADQNDALPSNHSTEKEGTLVHCKNKSGTTKLRCTRCHRSFFMEERLKSHTCFLKKELHLVDEEEIQGPSNPFNATSNVKLKSCSVSLTRLTDAEVNSFSSSRGTSEDSVVEEDHSEYGPSLAVNHVAHQELVATVSAESAENIVPPSSSLALVPKAFPPLLCTCVKSCINNSRTVETTEVSRERMPKIARFSCTKLCNTVPKPLPERSSQARQQLQSGTCVHKNLIMAGNHMTTILAPTCHAANSERAKVSNSFFLLSPTMSSYVADCICAKICMMLGGRMSSARYLPGTQKPVCQPTIVHSVGYDSPSQPMNEGTAMREIPADEGPLNKVNFCYCLQSHPGYDHEMKE